MQFDAPLGVGARGGHGPIRYSVSAYVPGRIAEFRFDGTGLTARWDGRHVFEVIPRRSHVILRHTIDAAADPKTWLTWYFMIRPMHNALLEDALDRAESRLGIGPKKPARWGPWIRFLRKMAAKKAARVAGKISGGVGRRPLIGPAPAPRRQTAHRGTNRSLALQTPGGAASLYRPAQYP